MKVKRISIRQRVFVLPGYATESGYHEVREPSGKIHKFKKWDDALNKGKELRQAGETTRTELYDYDIEDRAKKGTYNAWGGRVGMGMPAYNKGSELEKELRRKRLPQPRTLKPKKIKAPKPPRLGKMRKVRVGGHTGYTRRKR